MSKCCFKITNYFRRLEIKNEPDVEESFLELEEPPEEPEKENFHVKVHTNLLDEESFYNGSSRGIELTEEDEYNLLKKEDTGRDSPSEVMTPPSPQAQAQEPSDESYYGNYIDKVCNSYIGNVCGDEYIKIWPRKSIASPVFPSHLQYGMTIAGMREVFNRLPSNAVDIAKNETSEGSHTVPKYLQNDKITGYINQHFIKKWGGEDNLSVCEREIRNDQTKSIGKANVFVSWPLSTPMTTLFDALENFIDGHKLSRNETYFWVSDFVMRPASVKNDLSWLGKCVESAGRAVLLMNPWNAPESLKRAYCIKEIYHVQKSKLNFDVIMNCNEQKDFEQALEHNFEFVKDMFKSVSMVDISKTECLNKEEHTMILEELVKGDGIENCNELVIGQLQNALLARGEFALSRLTPEERKRSALIQNMARLFQELGHYTKALPLFEEYLMTCRETLGNNHKVTLTCINDLAELLRFIGEYERAFPLFNEAIDLRWNLLGYHDKNTVVALGNKAEMIRQVGDHRKEALPLRQDLLDAVKENLSNEEILVAINNMVLLLEDVGEITLADEFYEEILVACRDSLGNHHSNTLAIIANMATFYFKIGENEKALALCKEVLVARRETLGDNHPQTIESIKCFEDIKKINEVACLD